MKSQQIRESFLNYFKQKGLPTVPSSPLIPHGDPTLLFTSAGMVQFKANFLGLKKDLKGAATVQKCLRTTDIDNVGFTKRHLTFFEMLGNFSFGDYFKKEAIEWAWDYLTNTLKIDKNRLYVSIYQGGIAPRDAQAHEIWAKLVDKSRIFELGEKDNFWTMGPTGPCGPCSEIYYDFGPGAGCPECNNKIITCDCGRYVEVWNLVFTQFNRLEDGSLEPLPQKNIDTGMGFERLCMVMQGVDNPFDTDLFTPLTGHAKKLLNITGKPGLETSTLRIIADHTRAAVFLIAEGVLPSNEGRGYILRRLLRRAARYGKLAGADKPFIFELAPTVINFFKTVEPDLAAGAAHIQNVLRTEEEAFLRTLNEGELRLGELIKNKPAAISGEEAFNLYETFGFPFELTKEILAAKGIAVDEASYLAAKEKAKKTSKTAIDEFEKEKVLALQNLESKYKPTLFTGYDSLAENSTVLVLLDTKYQAVNSLDGEGYAIFDKTPFYAQSGGQVGDIGVLESGGNIVAQVLDTQKPLGKLILHKIKGRVKAGDAVLAKVDEITRRKTAANHTAVHVINAALKKVLGENVHQAGSFVSPEKFRFDYTAPKAPDAAEIEEVYRAANDIIAGNFKVETQERPLADAKELKATILLGENYSDPARFVLIAKDGFKNPLERVSLELCGGTHIKNTGEIITIAFLRDSAVSSGVRRIEAVAGLSALEALKQAADAAIAAGAELNARPEEIVKKIRALLNGEKDARKEAADLRRKLLSGGNSGAAAEIKLKDGASLLAFNAENTEIKELRALADGFAAKNPGKIILVSTDKEGRKSFVIKSFAGGPDAGKLCKLAAAAINGSGGGKAEFAQGGGEAIAWPQFTEKLKAL